MRTMHKAYVFSYNKQEDTWEKTVYDRVLVSGSLEDFRVNRGQEKNGTLTLRILTDSDVFIRPEDVLVLDVDPGNVPPLDAAVVVSLKDNRMGSLRVRHFKIGAR